jgi:beta-galactosidase GanA
MVWNEPYLKDYCYCPHTLADFKKYLHEKYNADLDKLNRIWSTEFPVEYRDWNEIEAPSGHGFLYGGASAWADWSGFCAKRLYGAVAEVTQLTKKYDPRQRPTTTNICARHTAEKVLDQQIDLAELGKAVDILGYSFYTIGFESKKNQPHQKAYRLSRIRSASQEKDGRFWVLETEVGPTWNFQPPYDVRAMNYWQAIGHGSKALLGWNYRSRMSDSQVSGFHLNAWDGEITERAKVNGEFSRILQRNAQLLNDAIPEKQAAVLCLEKGLQQISAAHGATNIYRKWEAIPESDCIEIYHRSRPGAFKLLWDMNIAADFISEGNLDSLNKYKVLLIPTQFNVSQTLADALRKYVYEGGTIIAEAPFAFRDEFNILQEKAPGLGLDEIFGGYTNDMLAGNAAPHTLRRRSCR